MLLDSSTTIPPAKMAMTAFPSHQGSHPWRPILSHPHERPFGHSVRAIGASGLSTYRMVYARLSHFHCVPVERPALSQATTSIGTNLRRRLGSMLRQPLTIDEIHSPPVILRMTTVFRSMLWQSNQPAPSTDATLSLTTPEPWDCWLLLAYRP